MKLPKRLIKALSTQTQFLFFFICLSFMIYLFMCRLIKYYTHMYSFNWMKLMQREIQESPPKRLLYLKDSMIRELVPSKEIKLFSCKDVCTKNCYPYFNLWYLLYKKTTGIYLTKRFGMHCNHTYY